MGPAFTENDDGELIPAASDPRLKETLAEFDDAKTSLREALEGAGLTAEMTTPELEKVIGPRLSTDPQERKAIPVATGFIDYFPDAIACVAELSRAGNEQHNPGKPLFWDRSKSGDESDAMMRHFLERGTLDSDGIRHSAKVAWRAMANLQKELEGET